ncbi:hypothetical protein OROHE_022429 [Orobanche hederae]
MNKEKNKKLPPLLLTSHGKLSEKQSFYSLTANRYEIKCLPILGFTSVLGSAYGWLVLVEHLEDDCFLLNPTSMETIQLPNLEDPHLYNRCILSKPPTEPDCLVVFHHSLTYEFVKVTLEAGEEEECYKLIAIATFRGEIYGIAILDINLSLFIRLEEPLRSDCC